jgi:hypothetical protein
MLAGRRAKVFADRKYARLGFKIQEERAIVRKFHHQR